MRQNDTAGKQSRTNEDDWQGTFFLLIVLMTAAAAAMTVTMRMVMVMVVFMFMVFVCMAVLMTAVTAFRFAWNFFVCVFTFFYHKRIASRRRRLLSEKLDFEVLLSW